MQCCIKVRHVTNQKSKAKVLTDLKSISVTLRSLVIKTVGLSRDIILHMVSFYQVTAESAACRCFFTKMTVYAHNDIRNCSCLDINELTVIILLLMKSVSVIAAAVIVAQFSPTVPALGQGLFNTKTTFIKWHETIM